jgi:hypothetical protein
MLKKASTLVAITMALLPLSGVAALAATSDAPSLAPAPATVASPAPPAAAAAALGACGATPRLAAFLQRDAAPLFTPVTGPAPQPATVVCNSCTIVRGCFACDPDTADKAPCAVTICCGVETGRVCGTCSDHCVPPPGD